MPNKLNDEPNFFKNYQRHKIHFFSNAKEDNNLKGGKQQ